MNDLNCWKNQFYGVFRLRNLKSFFRCIKYSYQRITKGYCDTDLWNWYEYFSMVAADSLKDLRDKGMGYPGRDGMDTEEKWHDFLTEMANALDKSINRDDIIKNEYEDAYNRVIMNRLNDNAADDIRRKYMARDKEIFSEQKANLNLALLGIFNHFYDLWD